MSRLSIAAIVWLFACNAGFAQAPTLLLFGDSDHKTFLGCINCSKYDSGSVCNEYGANGSRYNGKAFGIRTRNSARSTPATAPGTNILHPGLSSLTRKADFTATSLRTNTSQTAPAFKLSISLQIWLLTGPSWMMRATPFAENRAEAAPN
jgi:hypothetical protein